MAQSFRSICIMSTLLASLLLAACGGGGDGASSTTAAPVATATQEPNAPQATGNTATDGFNWFNFRRQQIGLQAMARHTAIDAAAQGHSSYQKINDVITHVQIAGNPGFTGVTTFDRLNAGGYSLPPEGYAYGEVIASTMDTSGAHAAEELIGAIYHRFVIFEPMFKDAGAGTATVPGGYTYFTTDFGAIGLTTRLGSGKFVVYPFANQTNVPASFLSDSEDPDPVSLQNEIGYPISIHADIDGVVNVEPGNFTVRPRGGAALPVKLLAHETDKEHTGPSVAAIIPLSALAPNTVYDVQFIGTVSNAAVNRTWSFTTR